MQSGRYLNFNSRIIYAIRRYFYSQIEDNICNYGIFLVEDNANTCFLGIMYALWG